MLVQILIKINWNVHPSIRGEKIFLQSLSKAIKLIHSSFHIHPCGYLETHLMI